MTQTLTFQSTIVESEKINPLFTRVKIHVAYDGLNRNGSFISKETFEKAAESAKFCPIVGEWSETKENFLGHGGKIEITDTEVKYIKTTIPYGCISNEEPTWELVEQDDGTSKEYFTLIGYLWTGRFEELQSVIDDGQKSHSMEIDIVNSKYETVNGKKVCVIEDMNFSGFCILGDVEPCFEDSTISTYSLDKEKFKAEFLQMVSELKFSLDKDKQTKGGNKMPKSKKQTTDFSLTSEQLKQELRKELAKSVTTDDWGYSYSDYYYVDSIPDQGLLIAKDWDSNCLVGFTYVADGDKVSVDFSTEKRFKIEYVPMEVDEETEDFALITKEQMDYKLQVKEKETEKKTSEEFAVKVSEKETELINLQTEFEVLKTEKEELETFKLDTLKSEKEAKINEVFESVASDLTEDELKPFKEKAFEMEVEDLQKELFALIGQKAFSAKAPNKEKKHFSISITDDEPPTPVQYNSYDSIINKYIVK